MVQRITQLETQLNSLDPSERQSALCELADALARDEVHVAAGRGIANMLCRTFYSQDGHGHSPTGLAWLARKHGYAAAGLIDDVLDGVDEFLTACEMLGQRGSAGIAARVLVHQIGGREEGRTSIGTRAFPVIGAGFAWGRPPASAAALTTPAENPVDIEEFAGFVIACGALPCAAWQDGAGVGPYDGDPYDGSLPDLAEEEGTASIEVLVASGVAAASIVPDSVDALPPGPVRDRHVRHIRAMVRAAADLDLPILVGSPSHFPGDPLAPDFTSPLLAPMTRAFMAGAYFIYGHTVMQRSLALGYQSRWAQEHLPSRRSRNAFYESIGRRVRPGAEGTDRLRRLLDLSTPEAILSELS